MTNSTQLYKFQKLRRYLKENGYPDIEIDRDGFIMIRGLDFKSIFKAGDVSFDNEGIYVHIDGVRYKGYMFKPEYSVMHSGTKKFPKFHLVQCGIIQQFIDESKFEKYMFAISRTNTVVDYKTKYRYAKVKLNVCALCQQILKNSIITKEYTSENFFDEEKEKFMAKKIRTDWNGYVFGWPNISKAYRKSKNFLCENCSISPKVEKHQMYWDTHHIERDKLKNDDKDLQCLCKLCHKHVDEIHEKEMKNSTMVKQFIEIYREDLILKANPYIHLYR